MKEPMKIKQPSARTYIPAALVALLFTASIVTAHADTTVQSGPSVVRVSGSGGHFRLTVNGAPYFVKGAGGDSSKRELKKLGANSWRTWGSDDLAVQLAKAQKLNMMVTAGIWLGHSDNGFDYHNAAQVAAQEAMVRETVIQYRNSKALLIWALGNEMETGMDRDPTVWNVVEHLAAMVKKLDPNHPVMTVVAEIGGNKVSLEEKLCPDVDILGINSYAGCSTVPQRYTAAHGTKPYIITEFGPPGPWEMKKNAWGTIVEPTSTEKAEWYRNAYVSTIQNNPMCLGSYAFTWGHKQEATATWFGLTLPDESRLGAADVLSRLWTGKFPAHRCPNILSLKVIGSDKVAPGQKVNAALNWTDPNHDPVKVTWILQYDPEAIHTGGGREAGPRTFEGAVTSSSSTHAVVTMPVGGGGYRLFAYVRNNHNGSAVANVPIFVTGDAPLPKIVGTRVKLPFTIYPSTPNGAYVPSGFMGNASDIRVDTASTDNPHSGTTCIKCAYYAPNSWGGVVWQNPANNWGDSPGGYNLTGAKKLTFWARGATGGESVSFSFGLIGPDKTYPDSGKGSLPNTVLTKEWKQYSIDVSHEDLSAIVSGFAWAASGAPQPVVFYLDDLRYE